MSEENVVSLVREIAAKADELKKKITQDTCVMDCVTIFTHNAGEYRSFLDAAVGIGRIVHRGPRSEIFRLYRPLRTENGTVEFVEIGKPNASNNQLGAADFVVENYDEFKRGESNTIMSASGSMETKNDDVVIRFTDVTLARRLNI
jgi:hypothetical protein